jgi:hypothetical protein
MKDTTTIEYRISDDRRFFTIRVYGISWADCRNHALNTAKMMGLDIQKIKLVNLNRSNIGLIE